MTYDVCDMLHNIHSHFSGYSYSRPSPALFAVPSACKTASFPLPLPIAAHHLWHVQPPFMSPSAAAGLHSNLPQLQHPTPSFQRPSSFDWRQHGFVTPHTPYLTPHTSHLTPRTSPHTSHLTPHTSHLTPPTSHLTPHTSHLTHCAALCRQCATKEHAGAAGQNLP
jgi:hypothetical protein